MFIVIGIMFCGIALGYLFREKAMLRKLGKPINYTICFLLFLLGISVGGNSEVMNHLPLLGGQALLLAFAGTFGSIMAAWIIYHFFFRKEK
ncbi:MAG TPA: DUF340 domain-containing protein [Porphyromonadaceae bacterium]|nr:DUF340 domain-containing protein [Porphyromonadaceae bacterium]